MDLASFASTVPPTTLKQELQQRDRSMGQKIHAAFYGAVLFILLSLPVAYRVSQSVFNVLAADPMAVLGEGGGPTMAGIVMHSVLFMVIMLFFVV